MAFKIVGVDENSLFPPRVETRLNAKFDEKVDNVDYENTVSTLSGVEAVINGRLSENSLDNAYVSKSSLVVNVKDFGALGNDLAEDEVAIQAAIDYAGANGVSVRVPEGTYRVYETLYLRHDGIRIECDPGAVFKRYHASSIFLNGDFGTTTPNSDIHIVGGVYDMRGQVNNTHGCGFSFGKCVGFTIKNLDILNVWKGHGIEIEGSSNGLIDGVRFGGLVDVEDSHYYTEMIQVGQITALGFPRFGIDDKTPNHDITITRCSQLLPETGAKVYPCAVGNHSAPVEGSVAPFNITIENNDFGTMTYVGIRPWGWRQTRIVGNNITAPRGIYWDGDSPGTDVGVVISDNKITGSEYGILVNRARGARIVGNTITGGIGVGMGEGSSNIVVSGNHVNTSNDNVQVQSNYSGDNSKVIITDNTLTNGRYNIQLYNNSNGSTSRNVIRGNTGTNATTAFVNLLGDGNIITDNLVYSVSGATAILAPSGSDANIIANNLVPTGKTVTNASASTNTIANNRAF